MSKLAEVRNGVNNAIRTFALDALDLVEGALPLSANYLMRKSSKLLTTPIHIGKNATENSEWDQPGVVIGTKSATASENGTAVSVFDTAETESGGSAYSLSGRGAKSGQKQREVYSTDFYSSKNITNQKRQNLALA